MIIEKNVLKANKEMVLTNGSTFGKTVYLGIGDSVDNWHEITEEEAERLQNEETPTDDEATDAEKAHAYDILMGVSE